jgi:hypothetical protein
MRLLRRVRRRRPRPQRRRRPKRRRRAVRRRLRKPMSADATSATRRARIQRAAVNATASLNAAGRCGLAQCPTPPGSRAAPRATRIGYDPTAAPTRHRKRAPRARRLGSCARMGTAGGTRSRRRARTARGGSRSIVVPRRRDSRRVEDDVPRRRMGQRRIDERADRLLPVDPVAPVQSEVVERIAVRARVVEPVATADEGLRRRRPTNRSARPKIRSPSPTARNACHPQGGVSGFMRC